MDSSKNEYTTTDIAKLEIKRERLKEWLAAGFISDILERAKGPGTKNLFSIGDLYRIKLFKLLVEKGFNRETASIVVKTLGHPYSNYKIDWSSSYLVYTESVDIIGGKEQTIVHPPVFSTRGNEPDMAEGELFKIVIKLSEIKILVDEMLLE